MYARDNSRVKVRQNFNVVTDCAKKNGMRHEVFKIPTSASVC